MLLYKKKYVYMSLSEKEVIIRKNKIINSFIVTFNLRLYKVVHKNISFQSEVSQVVKRTY